LTPGLGLFRRRRGRRGSQGTEYAATLPDSDDPVIYDHLGDVYLALGARPGITDSGKLSTFTTRANAVK